MFILLFKVPLRWYLNQEVCYYIVSSGSQSDPTRISLHPNMAHNTWCKLHVYLLQHKLQALAFLVNRQHAAYSVISRGKSHDELTYIFIVNSKKYLSRTGTHIFGANAPKHQCEGRQQQLWFQSPCSSSAFSNLKVFFRDNALFLFHVV